MRKTIFTKVLSVGLASAMLVSMAACSATTGGDSSSSTGSTTGGTEAAGSSGTVTAGTGQILDNGRYDKIVVAVGADPQDLEPDGVNVDPRYYFIYDIYETLFDMADDSSGEVKPCIASGYEVVDGTTWKVTMNQDVYDWEGNNITANDVKFCFDYLIDSGNAIRFDYFDSIEIIDDYTFNFHWTSEPPSVSDVEFPLARAIVFSQKAYEEHGNFSTDACGTGAYTVKEFTPGSKLILEANDNYWGANHSELEQRHARNVQEIEFQVVTEASTAVVGLETGTLDVCSYVPTSMMQEFEDSADYNVEVTVSGDYYYLAPNCLTLDEDLRKAIFYALDNSAIATAMGGTYVAMDTFGTSYFTDYDDSLILDGTYITDYDVDQAQSYLESSGYDGRTLNILTTSIEASKNGAQMIQVLLEQVGIKSEINAVTIDTYQTQVAEQDGFDLAFSTIGGPNMVGAWHLLFDNEVNTGYTTSWVADDELQRLYDEACADATHDTEHMSACLDYVVDNAYMYSVVGTSSALVYSNKIQNMYKREGYYTVNGATYAGQ
jgi:ABC-type transport system substrate-binding protein